jgi:pathogenesis-related protein 1
MLRVYVLLAVLVLSGVALDHDRADLQRITTIRLSRSDVEAFVEAHNGWRARVGLLRVRWSAELAVSAQRWSGALARRGCEMGHDFSTDEGENIFFAAALRAEGREPAVNPLTPRQVVDAWGNESAHYSYARNTCAAGKRCGHYIQMVWATTDELGCGGSICADRGTIWVCRYRPAAIQGRRPY